ncbi:ATP-dependent DNA ligase [Corynebacterium sp. UBA2622]|uniref:ATP-dependent DNA ligase n=1 Tax=Corynebacterium sp. UBA2622 TaxID=1946393 RepID=UPI0025C1F8AA|nr:ATP-dependent DNA ligase [Corynebacterium sp. UBA2622]
MADTSTYKVGGRSLQVSSLEKVLYPATGTTKADVLRYYLQVAPVMIPHLAGRPVTRKRWPDGVAGQSFFRKNLEDSAPDWIPTCSIEHKETTNAYPLVTEAATLAWFGQVAALELHTPQWRFDSGCERLNPDRLVLDLDPGEGTSLADASRIALTCRDILEGMGLTCFPVTSGSKGIHIYAGLDGTSTPEQVSAVAKELARALEAEHPDKVIPTMAKKDRAGKVFLDWSQNNGSKTTVSPYSLRGRERPTVAAPRTWDELEGGDLAQLTFEEVLVRLESDGDPLAELAGTAGDPLATYRSMRDASKTAEPVPEVVAVRQGEAPIFVIQEHHASSLHWDFRLERGGVLASWAVPKGPPLDASENRLAVQTEDHPVEYASFEGTIAKGQYGAGEVTIWDSGTIEVEKWREGREVIAVLHGRPDGGLGGVPRRYALIHSGQGGEANWLLKLMKKQPEAGETALGELPAPMLPSPGTEADIRLSTQDGHTWVHEMKWDGYRIIAGIDHGTVSMRSRGGKDYTSMFPHARELASLVDASTAVLDGELVAFDADGQPDFSLLRQEEQPEDIRYVVFDILELNGRPLLDTPLSDRRVVLEQTVREGEGVMLPPSFPGELDKALKVSGDLALEGVVSKRADSVYRPGERTPQWVKIKLRRHQEVVVVGVRRGKRGIASLLVAVPDSEGELRYAGRVGTGFTGRDLGDVEKRLRKIERATPPLGDIPAADRADAWWVTPKLVAEVELAGRTVNNRVRQASWRGWRDEKKPADVRWEV